MRQEAFILVILLVMMPSVAGQATDPVQEGMDTIDVPFLGEVETEDTSIVLLTLLIALVDGFNPCSLWVLTFLLGLVIHSGSRKRIALVGMTFLTVTTVGYGLFIYGMINVFDYVSHLIWIQAAVALVAFIFGIVNIKDFFAFGKGLSFTIPDRFKPAIVDGLSRATGNESLVVTLVGTAVIAAGIVLVELPCTAGFPVIYGNILAARGITGVVALALLGLYLFVYLLDELAVFLGVTMTMQRARFEERHGRYLKLIGGTIMIALGASILLAPDLMESIVGTLMVFGAALMASVAIAAVDRYRKGGGMDGSA